MDRLPTASLATLKDQQDSYSMGGKVKRLYDQIAAAKQKAGKTVPDTPRVSFDLMAQTPAKANAAYAQLTRTQSAPAFATPRVAKQVRNHPPTLAARVKPPFDNIRGAWGSQLDLN